LSILSVTYRNLFFNRTNNSYRRRRLAKKVQSFGHLLQAVNVPLVVNYRLKYRMVQRLNNVYQEVCRTKTQGFSGIAVKTGRGADGSHIKINS
jgi:hypothetical protein